MTRWFRFYDCVLDDPKVQRLPGDLFKAWVNLLCLASRNGGRLPVLADVAFALRTDEAKAAAVIQKLCDRGLLDVVGDTHEPHNWPSRQYKSDSSTGRVQKHRRNVSSAVSETLRATFPLCSASVSVENTQSLEEEVTPARANLDKVQAQISEAAGEMPCAVSSDISPIVRLTEQGWNLEGHILPGIRDMARQGKRAGTWLYVANTLVGKAADIRAGPPPDAKPEPASVRFARKMGLN